MSDKGKNRREIRKIMLDALEKAPVREGLTAKELATKIKMPQPTARVHLELLEESNIVQSYYIGKSRLYQLRKKKKN